MTRVGVEAFFEGHPAGSAVFDRVRTVLEDMGSFDVRVSKSQVAFRRHRGFAYLWLPDRYLSGPVAPVVLSIALGRHDPSPRFKEVAHPSPRHWMHHLELAGPAEVDDEVTAWLREAHARAG